MQSYRKARARTNRLVSYRVPLGPYLGTPNYGALILRLRIAYITHN